MPVGPAELAALARAPWLTGLEHLQLLAPDAGGGGGGGWAPLRGLSAPHLTALLLGGCRGLDCGAIASMQLPRLACLDASGCGVGAAGARALAGAAWLAGLTELRLARNPAFGARAAREIAAARMPLLARIDICGSPLGARGAAMIAGSAWFASLEELEMGGPAPSTPGPSRGAGDAGAAALAAAAAPRLRAADLRMQGVGPAGLRALAAGLPGRWPRLERLLLTLGPGHGGGAADALDARERLARALPRLQQLVVSEA
jgi:hypothetical protein